MSLRKMIPDPFLIYMSGVWNIPEDLSPIPPSLEQATNLSEGDLVYLRRASQMTGRDVSGFNHSFYPGHIALIDGKLHFVAEDWMPSFPPGYGIGHPAGTELAVDLLGRKDFYKEKSPQ